MPLSLKVTIILTLMEITSLLPLATEYYGLVLLVWIFILMKVLRKYYFVSGVLYLAVDPSFSFLSSTTPYEYIFTLNRHLGYFQFGTVTTTTAISIIV